MGTRETLDRMPENVRKELEEIRKMRKLERETKGNTMQSRIHAYAYTKGLRDARLITERERQILYVYTTV